MERNQTTEQPNVFQQPVWDSAAKFEISGSELEALVRANEANSQAAMALQNIINTGLLQGTIKMKYFKANEQGSGYSPMTEEESKPYEENMQFLIAQAKEIAEKAVKEAKDNAGEKPAQRLDAIVNQHGEAYEDLGSKKLKVVE
jgi:hypothetical protein